MQDGLMTAIQVPLTVSRISNSMWPSLKELADIANINCKSDLQVNSQTVNSGGSSGGFGRFRKPPHSQTPDLPLVKPMQIPPLITGLHS